MGNIWKQFEDLLPKRKQFIGKVSGINTTDKTCTVDLVGGGSFIAKGSDVTAGKFYIIDNGEVLREVPELTIYSITVY